ncbi:hypothetical protein B296_00012111 [Ensete ventricosum]|uniref:Uncharacterized protein n=1 Tax=Ensete ventricosum TaxID=4639 RepID=A0A427ALK6_ENSVE|nr:hypothetical protein B296_00012111 [Ensete ventricosum]
MAESLDLSFTLCPTFNGHILNNSRLITCLLCPGLGLLGAIEGRLSSKFSSLSKESASHATQQGVALAPRLEESPLGPVPTKGCGRGGPPLIDDLAHGATTPSDEATGEGSEDINYSWAASSDGSEISLGEGLGEAATGSGSLTRNPARETRSSPQGNYALIATGGSLPTCRYAGGVTGTTRRTLQGCKPVACPEDPVEGEILARGSGSPSNRLGSPKAPVYRPWEEPHAHDGCLPIDSSSQIVTEEAKGVVSSPPRDLSLARSHEVKKPETHSLDDLTPLPDASSSLCSISLSAGKLDMGLESLVPLPPSVLEPPQASVGPLQPSVALPWVKHLQSLTGFQRDYIALGIAGV